MLNMTLANDRQRQEIVHDRGPLEFGRLPKPNCQQIVVDDPYTSREQLRVEELRTGDVRVHNLGAPITLPDGSLLPSGHGKTLIAPVRIAFGTSTLDIAVAPTDDVYSTSMQTIAKPSKLAMPLKSANIIAGQAAPSAETLTRWFEALLGVQRGAAGSQEFYADTARAVVELVGLDRGMVLLRRCDEWEAVASHSVKSGDQHPFSRRVLAQVVSQERTYFQKFQGGATGQSLANIEAVVASPVFNERDEVAGVVYGSRDMLSDSGQSGIDPLEAQFVQLLAGAVSAGLARLASEAEAARARVQFEQFFSPELAGALQRDPGILAAQQRELTLLFADLRGFSRLAERIEPSETYHLLADILDRLTNKVMDHGGVVIDYYGDGLAAMWNAPTSEPRHADRAAQAALAMIDELQAINGRWAEKLGSSIRLGIGLNTGTAQVGNSGSKRRLKYGPRGHSVNLTSRVEAATKVLGATCLMTGSTNAALTASLPRRRICRVRLPGLAEPVELFELSPDKSADARAAHFKGYEAALDLWERDQAAECLKACLELQQIDPDDGPTRFLLSRAEQRIEAGSAPFDPALSIETK